MELQNRKGAPAVKKHVLVTILLYLTAFASISTDAVKSFVYIGVGVCWHRSVKHAIH